MHFIGCVVGLQGVVMKCTAAIHLFSYGGLMFYSQLSVSVTSTLKIAIEEQFCFDNSYNIYVLLK